MRREFPMSSSLGSFRVHGNHLAPSIEDDVGFLQSSDGIKVPQKKEREKRHNLKKMNCNVVSKHVFVNEG